MRVSLRRASAAQPKLRRLNCNRALSTSSAFVKQDRLWKLHEEFAKLGALPKGGVNRATLSPEDVLARVEFLRRGLQISPRMRAFSDDFGNLFLCRPGADQSDQATPVVTGSHLDTQPRGGKYDGASGVLAGLEVLQALEDGNIRTKRPVLAVSWTNEEGARFSPGCMGSGVFSGAYSREQTLKTFDRAGVSVAEALKQTEEETTKRLKAAIGKSLEPLPAWMRKFAAYIELHIEQGPVLEDAKKQIGVVTSIQGMRRINVDVFGEEGHAGTTPRKLRRDAFVQAVRIVNAMHAVAHEPSDTLRFTVGRFEAHPGSSNTIPGHVHFTIDLRHPDDATLKRAGDQLVEIAQNSGANGCAVKVEQIAHLKPTTFAPTVVNLVRDAAERLKLPHMDLPSGALHDGIHIHARVCPQATGMIFVPCWRGISHNEQERATPEDLAAGTRVLADVVTQLANA